MSQENLLSQADNCVYCGLCSQVCPTYSLDHQELESPRGRVLSSLQVLQDKLYLSDSLEQHLKNCLFCGACERACPANVPIIELLSTVKAQFKQPEAKNIRWLTKHPTTFKSLSYIGVGLKKLKLDKLPIINRYQHLLPDKISVIKSQEQKQATMLFSGCSKNIDASLVDIKKLLEHCHIDFGISTQNCCGAIHAHAGDIQYAEQLLAKNQRDLVECQTLIYANTGCQDYLTKLASTNRQVMEASEFLSTQDLSALRLTALTQTVAVHIPCSQRYNKNAQSQIKKLLSLIPNLQIKFLNTQSCCGASQLYSDETHHRNNAYLEPSIQEIQQLSPDIVISSNLACRLNLQAATQTAKINVKIMHPLSLLNQQL